MPIINRTDNEQAEEEAPAKGIIPRNSARSGVQSQGAVSRNKPSKAKEGVGIPLSVITIVLLVGIIGAGGWFLSEQDLALPTADYDPKTVSLDIERAFRIRGLMNLLTRKIEQNRNALAMAEKNKDDVIADTMRLALAQNIEDLNRHQEAYIDSVVSLADAHQRDADQLIEALKATLSSATGKYKIGQADTVTELTKLLQAAPAGEPIRPYLVARLKPQQQTQ